VILPGPLRAPSSDVEAGRLSGLRWTVQFEKRVHRSTHGPRTATQYKAGLDKVACPVPGRGGGLTGIADKPGVLQGGQLRPRFPVSRGKLGAVGCAGGPAPGFHWTRQGPAAACFGAPAGTVGEGTSQGRPATGTTLCTAAETLKQQIGPS